MIKREKYGKIMAMDMQRVHVTETHRKEGWAMNGKHLLEHGTNELELLEFTIGENHYGINVAKVREILLYHPVTPVPNTHPCVEGIFMPREDMITVIDLKGCLGMEASDRSDKAGLLIITNFNQLNVAFHVETVIGIHRVSWADIILPGAALSDVEHGVATGVIKLGEKLLVILDFEKIVAKISPETSLKMSDVDALGPRNRSEVPIMIVEDSVLLRNMLSDCMKAAGYVNLETCSNGREAWERLERYKKENSVDEKVALVITDIEMPIMDGHRLTKLMKEDETLRHVPVVIFSSMVSPEMRRKGNLLGVDAQLSKPDIGLLIEQVDALIQKRNGKKEEGEE